MMTSIEQGIIKNALRYVGKKHDVVLPIGLRTAKSGEMLKQAMELHKMICRKQELNIAQKRTLVQLLKEYWKDLSNLRDELDDEDELRYMLRAHAMNELMSIVMTIIVRTENEISSI